MKVAIYNLIRDESAAALVEYALLLALIAIVTIVSMKKMSKNLTSLFTKVSKDLKR